MRTNRSGTPLAKVAARRPSRRAFLRAAAAVAAGGVFRRAYAADVSVPVSLQTVLMGKVAAFDRAFQSRSGPTARLIVAHKGGDSARIGNQVAEYVFMNFMARRDGRDY